MGSVVQHNIKLLFEIVTSPRHKAKTPGSVVLDAFIYLFVSKEITLNQHLSLNQHLPVTDLRNILYVVFLNARLFITKSC